MRIRQLSLDNFGPFKKYELPFVADDPVCMLLTGKNNEGKSSVLLGLKLIGAGMRSIQKPKQRNDIESDVYYRLPQLDVDGISIGRKHHNNEKTQTQKTATLDDGFEITVT